MNSVFFQKLNRTIGHNVPFSHSHQGCIVASTYINDWTLFETRFLLGTSSGHIPTKGFKILPIASEKYADVL